MVQTDVRWREGAILGLLINSWRPVPAPPMGCRGPGHSEKQYLTPTKTVQPRSSQSQRTGVQSLSSAPSVLADNSSAVGVMSSQVFLVG